MITNGSCTVFNRVYDKLTRLDNWQYCHIYGILWEGKAGAELIKGGMKRADSVTVFIPFQADTKGKRYKSPADFQNEPEGAYTLRPGDKLVKGIVAFTDLKSEKYIEGEPEGLTITSVETFDYGSPDLQHWEVVCQ